MRRFVALSVAAATAVALASVAAPPSATATPRPKATPQSLRRAPAASLAPASLARMRALSAASRAARQLNKSNPKVNSSAARLTPAADGTVRVAVSGDPAKVAAAVRAQGGRALASHAGQSSVVIPKAKLSALAAASGVGSIAALNQPYVDAAGPSEGVGLSGASAWRTASGNNGAGTKVAIVDIGFANIDTEVTATHLAANQADSDHLTNVDCPSVSGDQHGTAVTEIVHQMAPGAELFLYCIDSNIGFGTAVDDILAYNVAHPTAPITIASSSLGFFGDSRGDGSGDPSSTAAAVKKARQAGVLWIQSAGNQGVDHWGGSLVDANGNGFIDLNMGASMTDDADVLALAPGSAGADVHLQWDQWPTSSASIFLEVDGFVCLNNDCSQQANVQPVGGGGSIEQTPGTTPTLDLGLDGNASATLELFYVVSVGVNGSFPRGARYDLNYNGDLDGVPASACPNTSGPCQVPVQTFSQSVSAPANSPYALAVGAHRASDGFTTSVEFFSSQGPSIDGRVKPDITAWDGTSSFLPEFSGGFFGTSASAPHVAGAAALVKALHDTTGNDWDASQLQNFLQQRADGGAPSNPPTNARGFGLLTMGAQPGALPVGGQYQKLAAPVRILDTRNTIGGHNAKLGNGGQATVSLTSGPGAIPADATAVAINLTGVRAQRTTFLSVFPGGTAWPKTSNLNLTGTDPTAAVFAIVSVNALRSITVRNDLGLVDVVMDEVGFFRSNAVAGGLYSPLPTSNRVLDTRTAIGNHQFKVPSNGTVGVHPQAPVGATAAIVNLTAVHSTTSAGFLAAAPTCSTATSTLNFNKNARANLAIVGLDGSGNFCVSNSTGAVDVVVDVLGFIGTSGSTYVGLPAPKRIMDSRSGNGPVPVRAVGANQSDVIVGAGLGEVPVSATALFTGVTEARATDSGFLQAFAGTVRPAIAASTLNFSPGRVVPNAAVVGLDSEQFGIYNNMGNTQVVVDLFGYFAAA